MKTKFSIVDYLQNQQREFAFVSFGRGFHRASINGTFLSHVGFSNCFCLPVIYLSFMIKLIFLQAKSIVNRLCIRQVSLVIY